MNESEAQSLIVSKLEEAARRGIPERLFHCGLGPSVPPEGYLLPVLRLDMILSGTIHAAIPLAEGARELKLRSGDAYLAPPGSWERHYWDGVGEMLCIVPCDGYLRVSYYNQTDSAVRPVAAYHHTGRPPSKDFDDLKSLLLRPLGAGAQVHLSRALVHFAAADCRLEPDPFASSAAKLRDDVLKWLENHYHEPIGREEAAETFGVSPAYLSRVFKSVGGRGFLEALTSIRLDAACFLLEETSLPVNRVAGQCGFRNHVHFVRRFRELKGLSPGAYRRRKESSAPC